MDLWVVIALIGIAGAVGGVTTAISTDNSFTFPRPVKDGRITVAWQAGILGNMATAAVAALISWGLYGPSSTLLVVGAPPPGTTQTVTLSIATLFTAVLIGYGGARWLTNEVDKRILKATAAAAAEGAADKGMATRIASSSPSEAFKIATGRSV